MNIIIKNENLKVMDALEIEVIKTLEGIFLKEDLEKQLYNFYYNKAVVDITAISNYYDDNSLFSFLKYFIPEKLILVLNDSELSNSKTFLKKLIEKGYYNFTKNASGVSFLINKSNTYEDVKKYIEVDTFTSELYSNQNYSNNSNNDTQHQQNKSSKQRIIGIVNLTKHAGATTLMNLMVKQLKINYNVKGIEMCFQDSIYFRNNDIVYSSSLEDLKMRIKAMYDLEVIIIDFNDIDGLSLCDEILYLVEPGVIRLNKLIKSGINISASTSNGKIVLNRSSIKDEELSNFEYETKFKVFHNMQNIDDRKERIQSVDALLVKLGFNKQRVSGFFGFFK